MLTTWGGEIMRKYQDGQQSRPQLGAKAALRETMYHRKPNTRSGALQNSTDVLPAVETALADLCRSACTMRAQDMLDYARRFYPEMSKIKRHVEVEMVQIRNPRSA